MSVLSTNWKSVQPKPDAPDGCWSCFRSRLSVPTIANYRPMHSNSSAGVIPDGSRGGELPIGRRGRRPDFLPCSGWCHRSGAPAASADLVGVGCGCSGPDCHWVFAAGRPISAAVDGLTVNPDAVPATGQVGVAGSGGKSGRPVPDVVESSGVLARNVRALNGGDAAGTKSWASPSEQTWMHHAADGARRKKMPAV